MSAEFLSLNQQYNFFFLAILNNMTLTLGIRSKKKLVPTEVANIKLASSTCIEIID